MTRVTISEAKARLDELVAEAAAGGEVVIVGGDQRELVLLRPVESTALAKPQLSRWDQINKFPPVRVWMSDDFDEPLEDFEPYMQ